MTEINCACDCHTGLLTHSGMGWCPCAAAVRAQERVKYLSGLKAQILEYEHALEHVIDCASCVDCNRLAQSALDGRNRIDFLDIVKWKGGGLHE